MNKIQPRLRYKNTPSTGKSKTFLWAYHIFPLVPYHLVHQTQICLVSTANFPLAYMQLKVRTKLILRTCNFKRLSWKSPLSLNQLAIQVLQNGMDNGKIGSHSVPPSLYSKYQPMPEITNYVPGIIKLLCNLNPSKASGQDSIKPIVLKNLSNEITLFLSVLFQK